MNSEEKFYEDYEDYVAMCSLVERPPLHSWENFYTHMHKLFMEYKVRTYGEFVTKIKKNDAV